MIFEKAFVIIKAAQYLVFIPKYPCIMKILIQFDDSAKRKVHDLFNTFKSEYVYYKQSTQKWTNKIK